MTLSTINMVYGSAARAVKVKGDWKEKMKFFASITNPLNHKN